MKDFKIITATIYPKLPPKRLFEIFLAAMVLIGVWLATFFPLQLVLEAIHFRTWCEPMVDEYVAWEIAFYQIPPFASFAVVLTMIALLISERLIEKWRKKSSMRTAALGFLAALFTAIAAVEVVFLVPLLGENMVIDLGGYPVPIPLLMGIVAIGYALGAIVFALWMRFPRTGYGIALMGIPLGLAGLCILLGEFNSMPLDSSGDFRRELPYYYPLLKHAIEPYCVVAFVFIITKFAARKLQLSESHSQLITVALSLWLFAIASTSAVGFVRPHSPMCYLVVEEPIAFPAGTALWIGFALLWLILAMVQRSRLKSSQGN